MDTFSISEKNLRKLTFSSQELSTIRTIGVYRGKQELYAAQAPEVLQNLRTIAKIESSESSNRIEGIIVPRQRIEGIIEQSTETLNNRSEQEVAGYRDALQLIHESSEYMPLTSNLVLQLHSLISRYTPNSGGQWKPTDNEIIETNADGKKSTRFKAIPAVQTPFAMEEWQQCYNKAIQTVEPLVVIPLAIFDFLCIHPFLDGNGRTSRLLTLLMLYQHNYQVGHFISLERLFEETKESYYETLQTSSKNWHSGTHDIKPWLRYFWGVLLRAYRELEEKVSNIEDGKGSKTEWIKQVVNSMVGPFSISDIQEQCTHIGRPMIKLVLDSLKKEGIISLQGKGRGSKWIRNHE